MTDWNKMIEQTRAAIAEYEQAAESLEGVLLGQGYVVVCQELTLAFDIKDGVVTNPRTTAPQLATRFTLDDAGRVADEVKNGNDQPGEVMHVRHAIAAAIAGQRELLCLLEAHTDATSERQ